MNSHLAPWLLSHLSAGALLGGMLLVSLLLWRGASAAQQCTVIGVFLTAMMLLTPLQSRWWPQIDVPVLSEVRTTAEPALLDSRSVLEPKPAMMPEAVLSAETSQSMLPVVLMGIWVLGASLLLMRFAVGTWLWRRLWSSARLHERTKEHELRVSGHTNVPMASGRQILMPAEWLEWPEQDQRAALEHELAHARHHDGLIRGLAAVATALHWPSPFVWMAERRLRLAQEQRCDEIVLASGIDAGAYGRLLMRCARRVSGGGASSWLSPAVACMARPSQLAERIEHLAKDIPNHRPARWLHVAVPLLIVLAALQALHVRLVAKEADFKEEIQAQRLKAPEPQRYNFKDAQVADVLRFLAGDVLFGRFILGEMDEARLISFDIEAPPLDVFLQVCDLSGLTLTNSGRYWVAANPGSLMPTTTAGEAAQKLRAQKEQQYDFSKARAGDVLRFLFTDAGVKFTPLPKDMPEAERLVTFSVKDSPFGTAEALCGTLGLILVEEDGIWHALRKPAAQTKAKSASELNRVRAVLAKLPFVGEKLGSDGRVTKIMLGDILLEKGTIVPPVFADQTGQLRVKAISQDHVTFIWTESGKEDVSFNLPMTHKVLLKARDSLEVGLF